MGADAAADGFGSDMIDGNDNGDGNDDRSLLLVRRVNVEPQYLFRSIDAIRLQNMTPSWP